MRVAFLGGSFNPFHHGHMEVVDCVHSTMDYDQILLIPSFLPVHKSPDLKTPPSHRLGMTRAAAATRPFLKVEDCELQRQGPSYTIDTIRELKEKYHFEGKLGMIIGDDLLGQLESWKSIDKLLEKVDLLVAKRVDDEIISSDFPFVSIPNGRVRISSSEIRNRVQKGEHIKQYVPAPVAEYIGTFELYRN